MNISISKFLLPAISAEKKIERRSGGSGRMRFDGLPPRIARREETLGLCSDYILFQ
jgi:hypothetical protein